MGDRVFSSVDPHLWNELSGIYVCKLIREDNSTFKQSINITCIPNFQINVNPVMISVTCGTEKSTQVALSCSVNNNNTVRLLNKNATVQEGPYITYDYVVPVNCENTMEIFTCESLTSPKYAKNITLKLTQIRAIKCEDETFGDGPEGFKAVVGCKKGKVGEITAVCQSDSKYGRIQDNCILEVINNLLDKSKVLNAVHLPWFLEKLSNETINLSDEVTDSPATIDAIVRILSNVANTSSSLNLNIEQDSMKNILETAGILTADKAQSSWETLNKHNTNNILGNPKCVFWDFNLFEGHGGWSDEGCMLAFSEIGTIRCNCNHTTSFSILMSTHSHHPKLDLITYIGVCISMASLVICLIIEGIIWRKINKNATSYLRHISIVNIAVCLLTANIWFLIGAAVPDAGKKSPPACTAATFFAHLFYLALFFWMLASALLLLYRTVWVFHRGLSITSMLAIGFSLGYGAPLIIVTITIATTAPSNQYIRDSECWLTWDESKALLAFLIPALMITAVNFIILIVVISKLLRRRVGKKATQAGEKNALLVIARSLVVLTPFFGLSWGLGIGTLIDTKSDEIHWAFTFFNSLQGFFILMFGTLTDKKARSAITMTFSCQNVIKITGAKSSFSPVNLLDIKTKMNE
ncbi:hypothetical protein AMECASPLE_010575 [Ameca splendens]|uniref:Uncharacterized protein n=1 Tax=Ameca splendens TaxID=208324 RepID=A0ABV0Z9Q9_9TELE